LDRVFLDANVLFSAASRADAGILKLWKLNGVELLTSAYALEEARINLYEEEQRARLDRLTRAMEVIASHPQGALPSGVKLPLKDQPILLAAIKTQATHLLTGDLTHFGHYFGRTIAGVLILPPANYLRARSK
jgi:predicted nucleic acid-binding protein